MKIELIRGDILKVVVEAIVNPSNPQLLHGGGLCGIIHDHAGPELFAYLKQWKRDNRSPALQFGEAIISPAFNLPHKYIIHAVGAVWQGGEKNESEVLTNCYNNILKLAEAHEIKSIAIPNVSTGIYGYPKEKAAQVAIETVRSFEGYASLNKVVFVCWDEENYNLYEEILQEKYK